MGGRWGWETQEGILEEGPQLHPEGERASERKKLGREYLGAETARTKDSG